MRRWRHDVIIEWNQLLQRNITGPPIGQPRNYAILHIAMADAVVAINRQYRPFHARLWAPSGASAEAAAAQAGHDVLVSLFPATQAAADTALANRLAQVPPSRRALGVQVGMRAAAAILAWRQNDGYASANPQPPAFLASTLPGIWRPTASRPYQYSEIGNVEPFGLLTPSQFLPTPFPQLESTAYAEALNEVKAVGRAPGGPVAPVRTAEETRFAQLFAGVGTFANVTGPFRSVASRLIYRATGYRPLQGFHRASGQKARQIDWSRAGAWIWNFLAGAVYAHGQRFCGRCRTRQRRTPEKMQPPRRDTRDYGCDFETGRGDNGGSLKSVAAKLGFCRIARAIRPA